MSATPRYTLHAGRVINRDGRPFVAVDRIMQAPPADCDLFARDVVRNANVAPLLAAALADLIGCADPHRDRAEIAAARDILRQFNAPTEIQP